VVVGRPANFLVSTSRLAHTHTHSDGCCRGHPPRSAEEQRIYDKLMTGLEASEVNVIDISGGCGSMYRVEVISKKFNGKGVLEQHRMVNDVLKSDIANMHGLTIKTKAANAM